MRWNNYGGRLAGAENLNFLARWSASVRDGWRRWSAAAVAAVPGWVGILLGVGWELVRNNSKIITAL